MNSSLASSLLLGRTLAILKELSTYFVSVFSGTFRTRFSIWAPLLVLFSSACSLELIGAIPQIGGEPAAKISPQVKFPWKTDGILYTSLEVEGMLYIGGDFSQVGRMSGQGLILDPLTADSVGGIEDKNPIYGPVRTAVSDGLGGFYIGGDFVKVGSQTRNYLAHLLSDGSLDPDFNPNADGAVWAMLRDGDDLYLGGSFSTIDGAPRNRLAKIDLTTGTVTAWDPNVTGNRVSAFALGASTIYVGGFYSDVGGNPRGNISEIDLITGSSKRLGSQRR